MNITNPKLSDRLRPDVEAARWVIAEIENLEQQLSDHIKREVVVRDAILKRMASENRWPDYIQEALAATEQGK